MLIFCVEQPVEAVEYEYEFIIIHDNYPPNLPAF